MAKDQLLAGFDAGQTHTSCKLAWLKPNGELSPIAQGQGPGFAIWPPQAVKPVSARPCSRASAMHASKPI